MLYIYVVYLHIMFLSLDVRRWNIYSPSLQDPIPRLPWPLGVLPSAQLVPELSCDMYIYIYIYICKYRIISYRIHIRCLTLDVFVFNICMIHIHIYI